MPDFSSEKPRSPVSPLISRNRPFRPSDVVTFEGEDAVIHAEDTVGVFGDGEVMGDHDEGLTHFLTGLEKEFQHFVRVGAVEVAGRFVCEEDVGHIDHRAGDGDALLLTAGQLGGKVDVP